MSFHENIDIEGTGVRGGELGRHLLDPYSQNRGSTCGFGIWRRHQRHLGRVPEEGGPAAGDCQNSVWCTRQHVFRHTFAPLVEEGERFALRNAVPVYAQGEGQTFTRCNRYGLPVKNTTTRLTLGRRIRQANGQVPASGAAATQPTRYTQQHDKSEPFHPAILTKRQTESGEKVRPRHRRKTPRFPAHLRGDSFSLFPALAAPVAPAPASRVRPPRGGRGAAPRPRSGAKRRCGACGRGRQVARRRP